MIKKEHHPGFTLLEVTLVVGILAIMLSLTLVVSFNAITSTSLRAAENLLVQTMRRAQTLSQNNINGSQWGVYICDAKRLDEGTECDLTESTAIVLYERDTFTELVADDQLYEFNPQIVFSDPPSPLYDLMSGGGFPGLTFERFTGDPLDPDFIGQIVMTRNAESRVVTVNERGIVDH